MCAGRRERGRYNAMQGRHNMPDYYTHSSIGRVLAGMAAACPSRIALGCDTYQHPKIHGHARSQRLQVFVVERPDVRGALQKHRVLSRELCLTTSRNPSTSHQQGHHRHTGHTRGYSPNPCQVPQPLRPTHAAPNPTSSTLRRTAPAVLPRLGSVAASFTLR